MKQLETITIYKGHFNETQLSYERKENAKVYLEERQKIRDDIRNGIIFTIALLIFYVAGIIGFYA